METGATFLQIVRPGFSFEAFVLGPNCLWNWLKWLFWNKALAKKREALALWTMHRWWKFHHLSLFSKATIILWCWMLVFLFDFLARSQNSLSPAAEDSNDGSNIHGKFYVFQNAFADGLSRPLQSFPHNARSRAWHDLHFKWNLYCEAPNTTERRVVSPKKHWLLWWLFVVAIHR